MRDTITYVAHATARDGDNPRVETIGAELELSTPKELGGAGGEGSNAEALLAAGYASCLLAALKLAAIQRQVDIGGAEVRCRLQLTSADGRFEVDAQLEADIPSVPADVARELLDAACAAWPYAADRGGKVPQVGLADQSRSGGGDDVTARREAADGGGYS